MTHRHRSDLRSRLWICGFGTLLAATWASTAHAAHYQVLTSNIAADRLIPGDNYCSLAEAVKSINDNKPYDACVNINSADPGRISLAEAPNKPFSTTHYVFSNSAALTLSRSVLLTVSEEGHTAYIDSPGALAIKVNNGANVSLYGLDIKHTGTGSGRLIWNAGTLSMSNTLIHHGNVTTEPTGRGGGIYNERTGNLTMYDSQVFSNSAKRGGGIYNDNGVIQHLDATISQNSATIAGGGLYNYRSGTNPNAVANLSAVITNNSAKYGAGVANIGAQIFVNGDTSITSNSTVSGTIANNTTEVCHLQVATCTPTTRNNCSNGPCDGNGAGVLNLTVNSSLVANISTSAILTVSSNTALGYGGAFYSTGQLNLDVTTMSLNKAKSGAAVFASALLDSNKNPYPHYCEFLDLGNGFSAVASNTATGTPANTKYSIVDSSGSDQSFCAFRAMLAGGNSSPYCNPLGLRPEFPCPQ